MVASIKQWFAPPVFEGDEKKTYRVKLLNVMINLAVCFMVLIVVGNLLDSSTPPRNFVIDFIFIGMFLFLRRLLFADRVKLVGNLIVISAFILMTVSVASAGTILIPTTALFSLLVIISGFIFNLWGIITATIISSLLVAGLILAHHAGILPPPNYTESAFQWFVFTCTFGLTGGLAYFYNQLTDQALERSRMEIRERQRAEAELRKLTRAVEQSPASIVITDMDGNIEYVNPRFTQVTGYGFDEAIGKNPRILKTNSTPPETYRQLWETVKAGKEWRGEFVNHKKDGSLYYESAIISPITDVNGVATHYLAVKEDITERKRAEDALQKANDQLRADMEKIEQLQEELREQAIHDPLTGLYNRRYLNEALARELARVEREKASLSIIISDIDHFKMINDTYGHLVGDKFLVEIASLMKNHARGSDIVCRYGGEEFLLALPGTALDSAAKRAEEIRQKCAEIVIQHEGKDLKVTMSFGVATYPNHGKEAEEIIIKADKAMYQSKHNGRNCVTIREEEVRSEK